MIVLFFFSSRRRHTICALVTGVQTWCSSDLSTGSIARNMTPEFGSPRTAIVTGGARRIGEAFTRALAEDGWHVLIHCSKSVTEAEALAAELANARVLSADLAAGDWADRIFSALAGLPPPVLPVHHPSPLAHKS